MISLRCTQSFLLPLRCTHLPLSRRAYSGPLIKTYSALTSPVSVWWSHRVPLTAKYASALISTALGVTHIAPSTLITLGPPTAAAAYFLLRRFQHAQYRSLLALVKGSSAEGEAGNIVKIQNYDPADRENVVAGIENEFDSFRSQIVPVVRSKLLEYVIDSDRERSGSQIANALLDENKQVGVYVQDDPETFVTLKAESESEGVFPSFISFSVPYFSSRHRNSRRRLGTLQVSMLENVKDETEVKEETENEDASEEDSKLYKVAIQAWPYAMFSKPERVI